MSRAAWLSIACLMAPLLGGCAEGLKDAGAWIEGKVPQEPYKAAKMTEPKGSDFNRHLYDGYIELAEGERAEYDWRDSRLFSEKALAAAEDQAVGPDPLYDRRLPPGTLDELKAARKNLTELLEGGARRKSPARAAEAQVGFDCWVQEQEENHQPEDIAACRARFEAALDRVRVAMGQPGKAYVVYFDTGSTTVARGQLEKLMKAAALAKGARLTLRVSGHADTVGADAENLSLSLARTKMVEDLLISAGVKAEKIKSTHYGASRPAVETGPSTAEARNRRVEIQLVR